MSDATKIAVIGGGPGGYVAAIRATQLGAVVTLIEGRRMGGTCLNEGCIPTKVLLESAHLLDRVRGGAEFGITAEPSVDFTQVQRHKEKIVNRLVGGVSSLMKANGVTALNGYASFVDGRTLSVRGEGGDTTLSPDKIIIATGSKPVK
ncbi:MAG: FAD-dependent oxidoreductase, partial [Synergistaceae bacterium]|nr:FAD-dependent oxidoreductase [Synergistaceae bacterium]